MMVEYFIDNFVDAIDIASDVIATTANAIVIVRKFKTAAIF